MKILKYAILIDTTTAWYSTPLQISRGQNTPLQTETLHDALRHRSRYQKSTPRRTKGKLQSTEGVEAWS